MRKIKISKNSKKNYTIIFSLAVMILTVGYATFAQPLAHRLATMLPDDFRYGLWFGGGSQQENKQISGQVSSQAKKQNTLASNQQVTSQTDQQSKVWDVGIVAAKLVSISDGAKEESPITFDRFKGNFSVILTKPGDEIVYEFTIQNRGVLDAKVNNIEIASTDNNEAIIFDVQGVEVGDSLDVGKSTKVRVTTKYNSNYSGDPIGNKSAVMVAINYVQK